MSLNRFNPRRDENEPAIRKHFATHGWHTEQLSGAGMPDLLCMKAVRHFGQTRPTPTLFLCDVKMPGKKATAAQVEKWTALSAKGIPVYVASTEVDVDAIVSGTATPWAPEVRGSIRAPRPHGDVSRERKRTIAADSALILRKAAKVSVGFAPPRSTPVDATTTSLGAEVMREMMKPPGEEDYSAAIARSLRAAEQAAETFAPSDQCSVPSCLHAAPCPKHSLSVLGRP